VIRHKIAEMSHRVEALHALTEQVTYQMKQGVPSASLGGSAALLKVNASKCFEFCAREASQIFGGASYVQGEGQGATVERLYREVRRSKSPFGDNVLAKSGKYSNSPTHAQTNAQHLRKEQPRFPQVRGTAIPGGSEEIMLDLAMRQARL